MNGILFTMGLLLWAAAALIVINERNARRNSIVPTIVLANSFAAAINVFAGLVLIAISVSQLLS